jgi:hypothetical protein
MRIFCVAFALLGATFLAACSNAPPREMPPAYTEPAPEISGEPDARHVASRLIPAPQAVVRQWIAEGRMLDMLQSTDRVSKPARFDVLFGNWPETGAIRRVQQEDGHFVAERVLESSSEIFAYQIWAPTTSAGRNIRYGRGEFRVARSGEAQTELTWTYELKARNPVAAHFLRGWVRDEFTPFMDAGMDAFAASATTP